MRSVRPRSRAAFSSLYMFTAFIPVLLHVAILHLHALVLLDLFATNLAYPVCQFPIDFGSYLRMMMDLFICLLYTSDAADE